MQNKSIKISKKYIFLALIFLIFIYINIWLFTLSIFFLSKKYFIIRIILIIHLNDWVFFVCINFIILLIKIFLYKKPKGIKIKKNFNKKTQQNKKTKLEKLNNQIFISFSLCWLTSLFPIIFLKYFVILYIIFF